MAVARNASRRAANGELTTTIVYNNHLGEPRGDIPDCTWSRRNRYVDLSGTKHAEVHYYVLPDGTIGASGLLDPKEVLHNGIRYFCDRS